jgi:hypothetical protein
MVNVFSRDAWTLAPAGSWERLLMIGKTGRRTNARSHPSAVLNALPDIIIIISPGRRNKAGRPEALTSRGQSGTFGSISEDDARQLRSLGRTLVFEHEARSRRIPAVNQTVRSSARTIRAVPLGTGRRLSLEVGQTGKRQTERERERER